MAVLCHHYSSFALEHCISPLSRETHSLPIVLYYFSSPPSRENHSLRIALYYSRSPHSLQKPLYYFRSSPSRETHSLHSTLYYCRSPTSRETLSSQSSITCLPHSFTVTSISTPRTTIGYSLYKRALQQNFVPSCASSIHFLSIPCFPLRVNNRFLNRTGRS